MTKIKIQLMIVRAFAKHTGMSLRQLSIESGIPYSTLWNMWNADFNPSLEHLMALTKALGLRLEIK